MKINENKLLKKLFESGENVVINNGDRFHLEDYIEYDAKPGLIVALLKDPDCEGCIQNLPIGAVDQFRFMNVTNEDAIVHKEKNNGKTYDMILKEYQGQKSQILEQWKKTNSDKLNGLMEKYGDNFIGLDIVQNSKQIQHKEEKPTEDEKKDSDTEDKGRDVSEMEPIQEDDTIDEGLFFRDGLTQKSINKLVDIVKEIKDKDLKEEEIEIKIGTVKKEGEKAIQHKLTQLLISEKSGIFKGAQMGFVSDIALSDEEKGKIEKELTGDQSKGNENAKGLKYNIDSAEKSKNTPIHFSDLRELLKKSGVKRITKNLKGMLLLDQKGYVVSKVLVDIKMDGNSLWFGFGLTADEKHDDELFT